MRDHQQNSFEQWRALLIMGAIILAVGGFLFVFQRLQGPTPDSVPVEVDVTESSPGGDDVQDDNYSILVDLSSGQSQPENTNPLPQATGEPLSSAEIEAILARLPALTADSAAVDFNIPQEILPPPRPGNTVEETFPPFETESGPGEVEAGPLQVLRFSPEGEIPIAPFISVTFNQAMIPLGTLSDLAATDVPVTIEPPLPGTWRWLGTKTLTFEYDSDEIDRLPKATEFHVTIPAGTLSINGNALVEAVTWTFKTPPPTVVSFYPEDAPQPLDPVFFLQFDQRIDPAAVLKTIAVTAGDQQIEIVPATQEQIEADERVSALTKDAPEGRWLAFRATQPFK
ncbi:MAG TPA: Ig-like domain-containing protein, partial [Anaerolineales bacterium]|nr:Ig-like domain-containing protein [Anaerolineales bacterium]